MSSRRHKPEYPPIWPKSGFYPLSLDDLRAKCVDAFPLSRTRKRIMDGFAKVVGRLIRVEVVGELWVDGSFTTQAIDPDDVDVLLHISGEFWSEASRERTQEKMRAIEWFTEEARRSSHYCDTYWWVEYPCDHPLHGKSEDDLAYWTLRYGRSRAGADKGIAVVNLWGGVS